MSARKRPVLRMTLSRDDVVHLIWSLESLVEGYTHHGGLDLISPEMELLERLRRRLDAHDRPRAGVSVAGEADQG